MAAGEEIAVKMAEACSKANVTIRRFPPPHGEYREGETVAVSSIKDIVQKKGVSGGARVLNIFREADRAPLSALEIKATFALLYDLDWKGQFEDFDLVTTIRSKQPDAWQAVAEMKVRKGMKIPMWRAVAITWFSAVPKKRKAAA